MHFQVHNKVKGIKDVISDLVGIDFNRSLSVEIDSQTYLEGKVKSGLERTYYLSNKDKNIDIVVKEKAIPGKVIYELLINNELRYEFYPTVNIDEFFVFSYENRIKYKIIQSLNMNAKMFHNLKEVASIKSNRSLLLSEGNCELIVNEVKDKILMSFIILVWDRLLEINSLPD